MKRRAIGPFCHVTRFVDAPASGPSVSQRFRSIAAHAHQVAPRSRNCIAFEFPVGNLESCYDFMDGSPATIQKDSFIDVSETPGPSVEFDVCVAKKHLSNEDKGFID